MIPESVLAKAASELTEYGSSGMSVMEMSHRGKDFDAIFKKTEASLRQILSIPDEYKVLFLQGGATLQFAMTACNLFGKTGKADYALTGQFSTKAFAEGSKFGQARAVVDTKSITYSKIPEPGSFPINADASFFHYCMNNTIFGTRWPYIPETGDVPIVCDVSSCILSEPLDVSQFGILYAGAQKNMGPAGLTVVILREDILNPISPLATYLDYSAHIKEGSMYNTPPTYGIYILGLVLDWIIEQGGLVQMQKQNEKKAGILYKALEQSSVFVSPVDPGSRSLMNVTFTTGNEERDARFLKLAQENSLTTLKGHRSVGGMRASIYNAMPVEGVEKLAQLIQNFKD
jgi:phosphoserine aminotransferase